MAEPSSITILYGGVGSERTVSLASGRAVADALAGRFAVEAVELSEEQLPEGLDAEKTIVFPALHGGFGEDGRLQALLETAAIEFCGSGSDASRLCMDKAATKEKARAVGIETPESLVFDGAEAPLADELIRQLGPSLVLKPVDQGSSVGLHFAEHRSELGLALSQIDSGRWIAERRIRGRELTVGLLNGAAMGIVEIKSASGVYDFRAKYTPGSTEYFFPAELSPKLEARIKDEAERLFDACGCRDFARIDFLLEDDRPYVLEVNTLPGLTATSLLPKSARCVGFDFDQLAAELVAPARERFAARQVKGGGA